MSAGWRYEDGEGDGKLEAALVTTGSAVEDIALDLGAGKLYWLDTGLKQISRAGLDGTGAEARSSSSSSCSRVGRFEGR